MTEFAIARVDDDSWRLTLEGEWDIRNVQKLYDGLAEGVALGGSVHVDVQSLTGTDTATIQLLLAVRSLCEQRGQAFRCEGLDEALVPLIAHMGLTGELEMSAAHGS